MDDLIDSLIKQTYKNWHLLVYNDGSESAEVLKLKKSLFKIEGKYTLLGDDHIGQFSARWAMWDYAKSGHIVNLDSDDYFFDNNAFKIINECFKDELVDAVFYRYVRDANKIRVKSYSENMASVDTLDKESFIDKFCNLGLYNSIHSKAFRTSLLKKMNCDKDSYLTFSEDRYETALLLDCVNVVKVVNNPIYFYRWNDKSITLSRYTYKIFEDEIFVEKIIEKFAKKWNVINYDVISQFQSIIYYNVYRIFMEDMKYKQKKKFAKKLLAKPFVKDTLNNKIHGIFILRKLILIGFKHKMFLLLNIIFSIDKVFTQNAFFRRKFEEWGK